jgi:hypothetical protein
VQVTSASAKPMAGHVLVYLLLCFNDLLSELIEIRFIEVYFSREICEVNWTLMATKKLVMVLRN